MTEEKQQLESKFWAELTPMAFTFTGLAGRNDDAPMTLHRDASDGQRVWIFTTHDATISAGGKAVARYVSKGHDFFARMIGDLSMETDESVIDRLWNPRIAAWYPGGRNDTNLCVLRFELAGAEVWSGEMSPWEMMKMYVGADVSHDLDDQHQTLKFA